MKQGSDEWKEIRRGKMTASHAQAIGNAGRGLATYIWQVMAEKHALTPSESYQNEHTKRGVELEPYARSLYELEYGVTVDEVGFIEASPYYGCSPDGLIGEDAGIEIKCHDNYQHFKLIAEGEKAISSDYIWQIQMNLLITRRKLWKYIAYNPNYEKSLLVFDILPDPEKIQKLEEGIIQGIDIMNAIERKIVDKK